MKYKGFTLIELLVVIVIIGILATISTATFRGAIQKANTAKAKVFSKQIDNGLVGYLIGWWDFNEGSGIILKGKDPNVVAGILDGGTWTDETPWASGYSLSFDEDDKIVIPPSNNIEEYKLISFWMYLNEDIIDSSSSQDSLHFQQLNNSTLKNISIHLGSATGSCSGEVFTLSSQIGSHRTCAYADRIRKGWHHFALSWDADNAKYKIYIDGIFIDSDNGSSSANVQLIKGNVRTIGRSTTLPGEIIIDSVHLFSEPIDLIFD